MEGCKEGFGFAHSQSSITLTSDDPAHESVDWNNEFQFLFERLFEHESAVIKLRELTDKFATVAKQIGTTIISEINLADDAKTIPPVTKSVGGVAGGQKFIYAPQRLFFKFATDENDIYGGHEYIMKVSHVLVPPL